MHCGEMKYDKGEMFTVKHIVEALGIVFVLLCAGIMVLYIASYSCISGVNTSSAWWEAIPLNEGSKRRISSVSAENGGRMDVWLEGAVY
jgi:hypothetical protein